MNRLLPIVAGLLVALAAAAEEWAFEAPPSAIRRYEADADWRTLSRLELEVALTRAQGAAPVLVSIFLETKQDEWYESKAVVRLAPGDRHRFVLSMADLSPDWEGHGVFRPWGSDVLRWVRAWGVKIFSPAPVSGLLDIGALQAIHPASPPPVTIADLELSHASGNRPAATASFRLLNFTGNPYATGDAELTVAADWSGGSARIPVYFRQDYVQAASPGGESRLWLSSERPRWEAAWLPASAGPVSLRLLGQVQGQTIDQPLGDLVTRSSDGFWGRSEQPVSPAEFRPEVRPCPGPRLAWRQGVWRPLAGGAEPAQWWVPLDWNAAWGRYTGAGEFDQQVAWRFEQFLRANPDLPPAPLLVFDVAELEDGGMYNWHAHPLNAASGGPLASPAAFFTSDLTLRLVADRARYLHARYGHYPLADGLLIRLDRADDDAIHWLDQLAEILARELPSARLSLDCPAMLLRAPAEGSPTPTPYLHERRYDLAGRWQPDPRLSPATRLQAAATNRLLLAGTTPLAAAAPVHANWIGAQSLLVEVGADEAIRRDLRVVCQLRTWRSTIWESQLVSLPADGPNRLRFPLADPAFWRNPDAPAEPLGPYDLLDVQELAVRVFASAARPAQVTLATTIRLWRPTAPPPPLAIESAAWEPALAGQPAHLAIALNQAVDTPFDPARLRLDCELTAPDGTIIRRPAYLHLPLTPDADGQPTRRGPAVWRVSFTPPAAGDYPWQVLARAADGQPVRRSGTLTVAAADPAKPPAPATATLASAANRLFLADARSWTVPPPALAAGLWLVPRLGATVSGSFDGLGEFGQAQAFAFDRDAAFPAQLEALRQAGKQAPLLVFADDELHLGSAYTWPHQAETLYTDARQRNYVADRARYLWARWGGHPAISGIAIDLPRPGPAETAWLATLVRQLGQHLPEVPVFATCPELPERAWQRPLPLAAAWRSDLRLAKETSIRLLDRQIEARGPSPGSVAMVATVNEHLVTDAILAVDVTVQGNAPYANAMLFLRTDRETVWQHDLIPMRPNLANRLYFRLADLSAWHNPANPKAVAGPYEFLNVQEIGLRLFNDSPVPVTYLVGNPVILGPYLADWSQRPEVAASRVRLLTPNPVQLQRVELAFDLNRLFRNPYDPADVQVDLEWDDPAGATHRHPGFFHQPIAIAQVGGAEQLAWQGAPDWRVRFTPQLPGAYRYRLIVKADGVTATHPGEFAAAPRPAPGFVRISPRDSRFFEFQDGSWYYPIGHNLRSPSDRRKMLSDEVWSDLLAAENAGVFAFDGWFAKMAANGENFARMWLCPWWAGLEWNTSTPGFHGLGYYNQENAARVDHVVAAAERTGIYLNLEPMNHGQLSTRIDDQWTLNPLCQAQPGGFLRHATDFFTDPRALALHRQQMRYVIARWGYSPAIAFWGVVTETEWIEAYDRGLQLEKTPAGPYVPSPYLNPGFQDNVRRWLRDTATFFRQTDAHPHLVTGHFSNPVNGNEMWAGDELQIIHNNAYTLFGSSGINWESDSFLRANGVAEVIHTYGRFYEKIARKPILIGEWGGTPFGDPIQPLRQELHTGIWAEFMTNCAGVTGWWWWNVLDTHDDYRQFKALAAFARGEDRRGRQLESRRVVVLDAARAPTVPVDYQIPRQARWGAPLLPEELEQDATHRWAITLSDATSLYAYIYTRLIDRYRRSVYAASHDDPAFPLSGPLLLPLPDDLQPGAYRVEYWNTFSGQLLEATAWQLTAADRHLPLPPHRVDLAVKLKPAK